MTLYFSVQPLSPVANDVVYGGWLYDVHGNVDVKHSRIGLLMFV